MLYIVVTYTLKSACGANFVAEIENSDAAAKVRSENGCHMYEYYIPKDDPLKVYLLEQWETEEHQKLHLSQPHMDTIRRIKEKYCKSTNAAFFKTGKYRHFKGKEYELLGIAMHSEALEPLVVYRALYGSGGLWVRPASMWNELVKSDCGDCYRFSFVGNDLNEKRAETVNSKLTEKLREEKEK